MYGSGALRTVPSAIEMTGRVSSLGRGCSSAFVRASATASSGPTRRGRLVVDGEGDAVDAVRPGIDRLVEQVSDMSVSRTVSWSWS